RGGEARGRPGGLLGVRGPGGPAPTEPLYADIRLQAGAAIEAALPEGHNAFAYVYEGSAEVGQPAQALARGTIAVLTPGASVRLASQAGARLILVAGK